MCLQKPWVPVTHVGVRQRGGGSRAFALALTSRLPYLDQKATQRRGLACCLDGTRRLRRGEVPRKGGARGFSPEAPVGPGAAMADSSCIRSHRGSLSALELVLPELKTPLVEAEGSDQQGGPLTCRNTPQLHGWLGQVREEPRVKP